MAKNRSLCIAVIVIVSFAISVGVARADALGESHAFSIDAGYDSRGRTQLNATLRAISERAQFYVADDYWNGLSAAGQGSLLTLIGDVGREFDQRIYPMETQFFGAEPNPGIDQDPRITILLADLRSNVGGYFDSAHEYPRSQVSYSNEREMLYLNVSQFFNADRVYSFIAHEFQHLISFHQKEELQRVGDDTWLNEMRSEYAVSLLGYNHTYSGSNLERRIGAFLQAPSDSLTEWPNLYSDYGIVNALAEYIASTYSPQVLADTLTSSSRGIESINDALGANGFHETFDDVFAGWMAANIVNNPGLGSRFAYPLPLQTVLRVPPTQVINGVADDASISVTMSLKDWEQHWYDVYDLEPGTKSVLKVSAQSSGGLANLRMPYLAFFKDGTAKLQMASFASGILYIPDIGSNIIRVILMPYQRAKLTNFGTMEPSTTYSLTIGRASAEEISVTPERYGLHEGDFIRAEGDKDVFIINQFGYKRIVLSPKICLLYGHLGARGCFNAIHEVPPAVRDAFQTSPYYTNGETNNGNVYQLIETGEDSAYLQLTDHPLDHSVFLMNTREQRSY